MIQITACIFDLDGVIVDTAGYHYTAWRDTAKQWDIDLTIEENEKLKGVSRIDSLRHILSLGDITLSEAEINQHCTLKNDHYLTLIAKMDESELLPNVKEFLEELSGLGIKIGLGSASKNAPLIIKKTGIDQYFESVISGNDVINGKPHPETFLKGADQLCVSPESTIVFEDSQKGITAAKQGGFYTVGIGNPQDLAEADMVIPGFNNTSFQSLLTQLTSTLKINT